MLFEFQAKYLIIRQKKGSKFPHKLQFQSFKYNIVSNIKSISINEIGFYKKRVYEGQKE